MSTTVDPSTLVSKGRVACGACLILHPQDMDWRTSREVLMIRRTGAHGEGTWSFPGGWVDLGEDPAEAAIREAWEEVSIRVASVEDVVFLGYTSDLHPEGLQGITLWFTATAWEGRPRVAYPARVSAVEWHDLDSPPAPLFLPVVNGLAKGLL